MDAKNRLINTDTLVLRPGGGGLGFEQDSAHIAGKAAP